MRLLHTTPPNRWSQTAICPQGQGTPRTQPTWAVNRSVAVMKLPGGAWGSKARTPRAQALATAWPLLPLLPQPAARPMQAVREAGSPDLKPGHPGVAKVSQSGGMAQNWVAGLPTTRVEEASAEINC